MTSFPFPQGATVVDGGVNFSIYSRHATAVTLCLFDDPHDALPSRTVELRRRTRHVWHTFVADVGPGQLYGWRVDGPYDPRKGMRFNTHKLLVDPYAKAITHKHARTNDLHFAFTRKGGSEDLTIDTRANDHVVPKCVVVDDAFDWQGIEKPRIPLSEMVIYEAHIKGFTAHPSSGVTRPGTFLGFIEKIPYLKDLGVNVVELLPIHECCDEEHLVEKGLGNYWGYNTLGWFAPDSRYAIDTRGGQVREFKTLVRECHRAGIEVILDVVYNHSCEGNHLGPTFSQKGIDNTTYYKLHANNPRFNWDVTGCGNTLNLGHPQTLRMVMDSLRYWAEVCHVDGFRFDLATALARTHESFDIQSPFLTAVAQDPILARTKLVAEPWDVGYGGYQLGAFPIEFMEWNGRYRDTVRRFVRGDGGQLSMMGFALTGSSDLFAHNGRTPTHSVNYVTCHDGFTMRDLVSFEAKKNAANREDNRDGAEENYSHNFGAEGETDDRTVGAWRMRAIRNFFALLFLSHGVPMFVAGDEIGRTQRGNNNAYCQDNEISWVDFGGIETHAETFRWVKKLIRLRKSLPYYGRAHHYLGADNGFASLPEIRWFGTDGGNPDWNHPEGRFLSFIESGRHDRDRAPSDEPDVLAIMNMGTRPVDYPMPAPFNGDVWVKVIDTSMPVVADLRGAGDPHPVLVREKVVVVPARTVMVMLSQHHQDHRA